MLHTGFHVFENCFLIDWSQNFRTCYRVCLASAKCKRSHGKGVYEEIRQRGGGYPGDIGTISAQGTGAFQKTDQSGKIP